MSQKGINILLVGGGGIGTIATLNLQFGGLAAVTCVLRSNFDIVERDGFRIESTDHGMVYPFRPHKVINQIPDVSKTGEDPFQYIVCATKNIPDVSPTLVDLIAPAVTIGVSVIVLIQNGLNIERPVIKAFPQNIILSGVSFCGSHEIVSGHIIHEDPDELYIGPFHNPALDTKKQHEAAQDFVRLYSSGGKTHCEYKTNVAWSRWRKLVYNACLNPICAITDLDTGRVKLAPGTVEDLVRPAMEEIIAAGNAMGHNLDLGLAEFMINMDPITMYLQPSMQEDVRKGRYLEFENILGEPLREGTAKGVPMPTIKILYSICRSLQWRLKEKNGLIEIPTAEDYTKPIIV